MNVQQQIELEKTIKKLFCNPNGLYYSISEVTETLSQVIISQSYTTINPDVSACYRVIAREISKISKFCEDVAL